MHHGNNYSCDVGSLLESTGEFFEEWNEITPQFFKKVTCTHWQDFGLLWKYMVLGAFPSVVFVTT